MKPGDLVTPKPIRNSHVACYRLWDIPEEFIKSDDPKEWKIAAVVDKFFMGESGVILQMHSNGSVQILSPRGLSGWVDASRLLLVEALS
jgi:hypothetical protein